MPGFTFLLRCVTRWLSQSEMVRHVLQARAVAEHLKQYDIKRVFVSPFYR